MASVVQICNSALNQLGAASITALTDNSKNARLCNERYAVVRDAVFRSHPWNSLIKRQQLAQTTNTPAYGFNYEFALPSDCLRVLTIDAYNSDYKVEGRKILCNEQTIKITYVSQETDPNEMDVLLRETISAGLAADIAYAITANLQVSKLMQEKYQFKVSEAKHTDASEGYNTDPENGLTDQILTEDFLNSRY
ncbi:tail tubular protein A [uncultured Mediterranean phage uvMED]|nr:tail tubular protein A [uncultured Mediterranean phage uvMED]